MKRILFLFLLFFVSTEVLADPCPLVVDQPSCPTIICSSGLFMGDDGKCYDCNTDKSVSVKCIGWEEAFKICPNRFRPGDSCGIYSELSCECFKGKISERIFDDRITYEIEDIVGWKERCVVDLKDHVYFYPDRVY